MISVERLLAPHLTYPGQAVDNKPGLALVIELAVTLLRGNLGQAPHQVRAANATYGLEAETARPEYKRHPGRRLSWRPMLDGLKRSLQRSDANPVPHESRVGTLLYSVAHQR